MRSSAIAQNIPMGAPVHPLMHGSHLRNACARTRPKFSHGGHRASRLRTCSLDNRHWITPQGAWKDRAPLTLKAVYCAFYKITKRTCHMINTNGSHHRLFPTPVHGPHKTKMFSLRHKPLQLANASTYTSFVYRQAACAAISMTSSAASARPTAFLCIP